MPLNEEIAQTAARLIGTTFADRYQILSVIGQGGMGVVYKAEHILMGRIVAIKMLLPEIVGDNASILRFRQEARAASSLSHANIVTVFDFGVTPSREVYLVMDFLNGKSLDAILAETPVLPPALFGRIFTQACQALQHAHASGIVHRDIKSSNIMLVDTQSEKDVVKIVDFGLAKLVAPEKDQQLTTVGTVMGSPVFMSPEQCRGLHCDERSDIYSLGCVMYRCLAGTMPIKGETALDTLNQHISVMPRPVSQVNPTAGIPDRLEKLVMKMLAKDPGDRQQSMTEVGNELGRFLAAMQNPVPPMLSGEATKVITNTNVSPNNLAPNLVANQAPAGAPSIVGAASDANASSPVNTPGAASPLRAPRMLWGSGVVAVLLAVGVFAATWTDRTTDPDIRPENQVKAVASRERTTEQMRSKTAPVKTPAPRPKPASAGDQRREATIVKPSQAPPLKKENPAALAKSPQARPLRDQEKLAHLPAPPSAHEHKGEQGGLSLDKQAFALLREHKPAEAEKLYAQSFHKREAVKDPEMLADLVGVITCLLQQKQREQAATYYDKAIKLYEANADHFKKRPFPLLTLANIYAAKKAWGKSEECNRRLIYYYEQSEPGSTDIALPIFQLARAYCEEGKLALAQQTLERGMILTEDKPNVRGYADLRELYEKVLEAEHAKREPKHDARPKPHGHPGRHSMLIRNY